MFGRRRTVHDRHLSCEISRNVAEIVLVDVFAALEQISQLEMTGSGVFEHRSQIVAIHGGRSTRADWMQNSDRFEEFSPNRVS